MKEQPIIFETAKLAKEKGFDWQTRDGYLSDLQDNEFWESWDLYLSDHFKKRLISQAVYAAPTQSLLQKWLRETHSFHVEVIMGDCPAEIDDVEYFCNITIKHSVKLKMNIKSSDLQIYGIFPTYEEALEAGLQEALKLIKL